MRISGHPKTGFQQPRKVIFLKKSPTLDILKQVHGDKSHGWNFLGFQATHFKSGPWNVCPKTAPSTWESFV